MANDEPAQSSQDVSLPEIEPVQPTSHSGSTWKVLGAIEDHDGVGVLGHAAATSGTGRGVAGVTDSGEAGAAGVRGEATSSGRSDGVLSTKQSSALHSAGVRGNARNGGTGVWWEGSWGRAIGRGCRRGGGRRRGGGWRCRGRRGRGLAVAAFYEPATVGLPTTLFCMIALK